MTNRIPLPKTEKVRANLHLEEGIVEHFKHASSIDDAERTYGQLINKVLRDYIESLPPEERYHNR